MVVVLSFYPYISTSTILISIVTVEVNFTLPQHKSVTYIIVLHLISTLSLEMSTSMNKKVILLRLIFRWRILVRKMSLIYFMTLLSGHKLRLKLEVKMLRLKLILENMEMLELMQDMKRI